MSNMKLLEALNHGPLTEGLELLPAKLDSIMARSLILKIVMQESGGIHRDQLERNGKNTVLGPALGLGQFERGGACTGLLRHPATKALTEHVLDHYGIEATPDAFWRALANNDGLAMAACRLNLLWLPAKLPLVDNLEEGHRQYLEAWRPGAWDRGSAEQRLSLVRHWRRIHDEVNSYFRLYD